MDTKMFISQAIAAGLGLVIKGLNFKLEGESQDATTRGARLYIDHLEGVRCPRCKQAGTLARILPLEKRDLAVMAYPISDMSDETRSSIDSEMLDKHSFIQTDGPSSQSYRDSTMGPLEHQISLEKQLKEQVTGWLCISCFQEVPTEEFIDQMRKHERKVQSVTRSAVSDVAKKQHIHVFFVSPKEEGETEHYFVLGDPSATTSGDLLEVGGIYECVVFFQQGEDPETVKQKILEVDLDWQDHMRARCDLHFFYPVEHRDQIIAHLEVSRSEFVRNLKLHLGNEKVGYATFKDEGYACGELSSN